MSFAPYRATGAACLGLLTILAATPPTAQASQTVCTPKWVNAAHAAPYASAQAANTSLLQTAISNCAAAGTASLPALVDLKANGSATSARITSVTLASNIVLKIEAGFTLQGPTAAEAGYTGNCSSNCPTLSPMISGKGLSNVTITGTGTFDGNGQSWWDIYNQGGSYTTQSRPKFIDLTGSNLKVGANFDDQGNQVAGVSFPTPGNDTTAALKIKNAPMPHLEFESGSYSIVVDGVWIYSPPGRANLGTGSMKNVSPNTDGIDLVGVDDTPGHATSTLVQNCVIDVGDDDIAIKSNKAALSGTSGSGGAAYNITVRNCVFGGGHGLSIGGQETGGVYNLTAGNLYFNGTDFGLKVKTDNTAKDTGIISNLSYKNVCMQNVAEPIQLTYRYATAASAGAVGANPLIENVTYDNIVATNSSSASGQSVLLGEITGTEANAAAFTGQDLISNNISLINSAIGGPAGTKPFTVTAGTLHLGTNSQVATQITNTGMNDSFVLPVGDSGPTVVCPATIVIPPQL